VNPPLAAARAQNIKKRWIEQGTESSDVDPAIYTTADDSLEQLFLEVLPLLDLSSSILEIGCNAGRSLDYLYQRGFQELMGIEIGSKAVELFSQTFPDTYEQSNIVVGDAAREIRKLDTDSFDLVFAHSVLVSISASDNAIFREMCRICRGYILILESEGSWSVYPRDFKKMFEKNGFRMVSYRWMVWNEDRTRLTIPREITDQSVFSNNTIRLFAPLEYE